LKASMPDRKLQERLLLAREVPGDRLVLEDSVLLEALSGSRALSAPQLAALQASPLTLKRFRHLALQRRRSVAGWRGSAGMLRAASTAVHRASAGQPGHRRWLLEPAFRGCRCG